MNAGILFSGFGGIDLGFQQAGGDGTSPITPVWSVEYDSKIAAVHKRNFDHPVYIEDVRRTNFDALTAIDVLHASPPCPNFSTAKADAGETKQDIELADAVCRSITVCNPRFFTLENVIQYRDSISFKRILQTLHDRGYRWYWDHINMADFGVPQTRKRLILIAGLGRMPKRLKRTHAQHPKPGLFETMPKWAGWYEVIHDLIPTLKETQLANWQLEKLGSDIETWLLGQGALKTPLLTNQPSQTITANHNQTAIRAGLSIRTSHTTTGSRPRNGSDRITTITASPRDSGVILTKGVVIRNGQTSSNASPRNDGEPFPIITASAKEVAKVLIDGQQSLPGRDGRAVSSRNSDVPSITIPATVYKGLPSVVTTDKKSTPYTVYQLNTRCLARLQTFPDSYELSGHQITDCRGIGNAVPPLFARRMAETLF